MICRNGHEVGEAAFCGTCGVRVGDAPSPWVGRVALMVAALLLVGVVGWMVWDRRQEQAREDCVKAQFTDALMERPIRDC